MIYHQYTIYNHATNNVIMTLTPYEKLVFMYKIEK